MYAIERIRIIKNYLGEKGQAQVHALSAMLGVSEVTVRRDLERLENEGWLTRTHGGAVVNKDKDPNPLLEVLEEAEDDGKCDEIAAIAVRMVADGDVVMLTNGPVNIRLASRLEERTGLTVLTNDLTVALVLSLQKSNRVVLLGGDLDKDERAIFGSLAVANLSRFFVKQLFVEVDGVSEHLQVSVTSQDKAELIRNARDLAERTVVLCPSVKFSKNAFYRLGELGIAHALITDNSLNETYKSAIFAAGIPLYTSLSVFEGSE